MSKRINYNQKRTVIPVLLLVVSVMVFVLPLWSHPPIQILKNKTALISFRADGQRSGNDRSGDYAYVDVFGMTKYNEVPIAISDNGRFVVFFSQATDLVDGLTDSPLTWDIFLRDRKTNTTNCITQVNGYTFSELSHPAGGEISISGDGRYIAFTAGAGLVEHLDPPRIPHDGYDGGFLYGHYSEIYVYDRLTGIIHVPTYNITANEFKDPAGTLPIELAFHFPSLSYDGSGIAFSAGGGGKDRPSEVSTVYAFHYDYGLGIYSNFKLVSTYVYDYDPGGDGWEAGWLHENVSPCPRISDNGQYVVFTGRAEIFWDEGNFWETVPNWRTYVIIRNLYDMDEYEVVSLPDGIDWPVDFGEVVPDSDCGNCGYFDQGFDVSDDGRYIVFATNATNMIPDTLDTDNAIDIYLYDRITAHTERISRKFPGAGGYACDRELPSISRDGRYITYVTQDKFIVPPGQTYYCADVFLYDRTLHQTSYVSVPDRSMPLPHEANAESYFGVISGNGHVIGFSSEASNLVLEDYGDKDNNRTDVFVRVINISKRPFEPVAGPCGYEANYDRRGLKIFPNPFVSFATIPGYKNDDFGVYDISGRCLGTYKGLRIGDDLAGGVYFITCLSGDSKPARIVKIQ
jgi:hypothetical protein